MDNAVIFLKEIHSLAQKLSWLENDAVVDELKELFIRNSHLLRDDENTLTFINELIYCSEKNVTPDDIASLIAHLNSFFTSFFLTLPCHVFFIGKDWNSYQRDALFLPSNMEKTTTLEINIDTDPQSIHLDLQDDTAIPIVVTDYFGFNFIQKHKIEFPGALTTLQFPEKDTSHYDTHIGYVPLLNARYEKLIGESDIKSVILGSSYADHGFPDTLLEKAVNLSVYSGDLTLAYSLIKNITVKTSTKNFMVCIGLYDMFYELSMGAAPAFPVVRYFCKKQNIEYNFRSKAEKPASESTKQYILGPLDLFVQHIYEKSHPHFFDDRELSGLNSMLQDEPTVKKSVDFINNRNYSTDFSYSSTDILSRVTELSRQNQRIHSFENNKEIVANLINLITETNSTLNFVIMPFPAFYIKNFDKNLKDETLAYIESITNGSNVFMTDLSAHHAFTPDDFYDTDHLNFSGAQKLCNITRQLGFEI